MLCLATFPREALANGSLYFHPFPARLFRLDVHGGRYRCVVSNPAGRIISRTVRLKPGQSSQQAAAQVSPVSRLRPRSVQSGGCGPGQSSQQAAAQVNQASGLRSRSVQSGGCGPGQSSQQTSNSLDRGMVWEVKRHTL